MWPVDRASQVRRNTLLLAVAQGSLLVAVQGVLTVGNLAVVDLTGRDSAAGLLFALFLLSAAVGALVFGRYMDRAGRRSGLVAGYGLVAVGAWPARPRLPPALHSACWRRPFRTARAPARRSSDGARWPTCTHRSSGDGPSASCSRRGRWERWGARSWSRGSAAWPIGPDGTPSWPRGS